MIFGALKGEDFRHEDSANIRIRLVAALKEQNIASSGKEVICYVCDKRICGPNPMFCPRCGRELRQ